jgi:hypothetical protein
MFLGELNLPNWVVVFVDVLIVAHLLVLAFYVLSLSKSFQNKPKEA